MAYLPNFFYDWILHNAQKIQGANKINNKLKESWDLIELYRVRLCDPTNYSLPCSSVHGILQVKILGTRDLEGACEVLGCIRKLHYGWNNSPVIPFIFCASSFPLPHAQIVVGFLIIVRSVEKYPWKLLASLQSQSFYCIPNSFVFPVEHILFYIFGSCPGGEPKQE